MTFIHADRRYGVVWKKHKSIPLIYTHIISASIGFSILFLSPLFTDRSESYNSTYTERVSLEFSLDHYQLLFIPTRWLFENYYPPLHYSAAQLVIFYCVPMPYFEPRTVRTHDIRFIASLRFPVDRPPNRLVDKAPLNCWGVCVKKKKL